LRAAEQKNAIDQLTQERNVLLVQTERFVVENTSLKQAYTQLEQTLTKLRQDLNQEFTSLKNQAINTLKIEAGSSLRSIGKDELVAPLDKALRQLQNDILALQAETKAMNLSSTGLNLTAQNLADALIKDSKKKGDFGELILANILESVGLQDKISYLEQEQVKYEGDRHIPDMVINLPDNRALIIDSKNLIGAHYEGIMKNEDTSANIHKALERAINDLASKKYVVALEHKLGKQVFEYIVLFIPNEGLFNQILQQEYQTANNLVDWAYRQKIILAGPSTLLLLVAIIDKMWRTSETNERAELIIKLANDLCIKLKTTLENVAKLGNNLKASVNSYNDLIGSFDNGETRSAMSKLGQLVAHKDLAIKAEHIDPAVVRTPASFN
jgi:DNA recombination protein RmuC